MFVVDSTSDECFGVGLLKVKLILIILLIKLIKLILLIKLLKLILLIKLIKLILLLVNQPLWADNPTIRADIDSISARIVGLSDCRFVGLSAHENVTD